MEREKFPEEQEQPPSCQGCEEHGHVSQEETYLSVAGPSQARGSSMTSAIHSFGSDAIPSGIRSFMVQEFQKWLNTGRTFSEISAMGASIANLGRRLSSDEPVLERESSGTPSDSVVSEIRNFVMQELQGWLDASPSCTDISDMQAAITDLALRQLTSDPSTIRSDSEESVQQPYPPQSVEVWNPGPSGSGPQQSAFEFEYLVNESTSESGIESPMCQREGAAGDAQPVSIAYRQLRPEDADPSTSSSPKKKRTRTDS